MAANTTAITMLQRTSSSAAVHQRLSGVAARVAVSVVVVGLVALSVAGAVTLATHMLGPIASGAMDLLTHPPLLVSW